MPLGMFCLKAQEKEAEPQMDTDEHRSDSVNPT